MVVTILRILQMKKTKQNSMEDLQLSSSKNVKHKIEVNVFHIAVISNVSEIIQSLRVLKKYKVIGISFSGNFFLLSFHIT